MDYVVSPARVPRVSDGHTRGLRNRHGTSSSHTDACRRQGGRLGRSQRRNLTAARPDAASAAPQD